MISKLKNKSHYTKNILTLMTGTTMAQAIPIAIMPVLTRLYTPEEFGVLALFIAITAILGSISNGRYELAIMLPEKDEDAINVAALGLLISVALSLLILIVVFLFNQEITVLLGNDTIGIWLYLVPFMVLATGTFNVLNYLNTRKKEFKNVATAMVYKSVAAGVIQLSFGVAKAGVIGLISGHFISQLFAIFRLAKNINVTYRLQSVSKGEILSQGKRYIDFPKYSMWAILANSLSFNFANILVSTYYSIVTLGFYSLAQKILYMPASLIGRSIGQVFFQEAAREKKETGKAINTFNKTSKGLLLLSCFMFVPLYFILPIVFELVFGKEWRLAGEYGQILLPFIAIQFVASSMSNLNNVFEKQKIALLWQLGLLVITMVTFFTSQAFGLAMESYLMVNSSVLFFYYLLLLMILRKVSKGEI